MLQKFTLKPKYKTFIATSTPLSSGVNADGTGFNLVPTGEPFCNIVSVPQYTFRETVLSKVKQKIVIQDTDDLPMKYQYFLFVQCGNNYVDPLYDPGLDAAPQVLATRNCWVFEDA